MFQSLSEPSGPAAPPIAVGARRRSSYGPVPGSYLRALAAAGGQAVVLAPGSAAVRSAAARLAPCVGLLLTGGGDVSPALYGGEPGAGCDEADPLRDACELALLAAAAERDLPVLAICHGMQLLNVARGGSLRQRLAPDGAGRHGTRETYVRHPVSLRAGSRLAAAVACERLEACSSHHQQAVARLGDGLAAAGWSDDGLVEAVEDAGARWLVGVQWHPEDTAAHDARQQRIFAAFVAAAAGGRARVAREAAADAARAAGGRASAGDEAGGA
jgi:putative glutamine amidotransferase